MIAVNHRKRNISFFNRRNNVVYRLFHCAEFFFFCVKHNSAAEARVAKVIAENVVARKHNKVGLYSVVCNIQHSNHSRPYKLKVLRVADLKQCEFSVFKFKIHKLSENNYLYW